MRTALEALDARFGLGLDLVQRDIGLAALEADGTTLPGAVVESAPAPDAGRPGPVAPHCSPPPAPRRRTPPATRSPPPC